jgi:alpha-ketoglutarate-dependent taurine dioxygenase
MHVDTLFSTGDRHPLVVRPESPADARDLGGYLESHRDEIDRMLLTSGGVLFRGFALDGAADMRACAAALGARPFDYVGGNTPRKNVAADVFTSTEYPASEIIGLHHEMSYLPEWPRRLFFYCEIPAATGGQTSLASSRDIMTALPERIVDRFREKEVTYVRHFHPSLPIGKSWQATYGTDDRAQAESLIASQGSEYDWLDGDVLRVTTRRHALTRHPETGDELWFNQAEQWHPSALKPSARAMFAELVGRARMPHDCVHGDGSPLDEAELEEIRRALNGSKLLFDWHAHDLLVIDNVLMMHGREAFAGERKTLAYLSAA